jgi:outer membrane lipoprotein-sorting protein
MRRISMFIRLLTAAFAVLLFAGSAYAMSAEEIIGKSQNAFLYQGDDFKTRVVMKLINKNGKERLREMTMLRKNYKAGDQKYFIYFFKPSDVRDMTFMVYKYAGKNDDRWLFVPAINMVRRIAAEDKASSFVGSDFTYEDISGRDPVDDTHELLREEPINGRDCYVIKSTPKAGDMAYSYKLSWIDKAHFLPLKAEFFDRRGELYRVFTADEVVDVDGFPTATRRTMKNVKNGHRTEATFTKSKYNLGINDSLFSERFLRRPLKKWID